MSTPLPPPPPPGGPPAAGRTLPPDHPKATISLVLGIIGLVACSIVAPFALVIGRNAVREIDAAPGAYEGRSTARAGYILGIIGTVILAVSVLGVIVLVIAAAASSS